MKSELERIWCEEPIAFALHFTKWVERIKINKLNWKHNTRLSNILVAIRGRKLRIRKS